MGVRGAGGVVLLSSLFLLVGCSSEPDIEATPDLPPPIAAVEGEPEFIPEFVTDGGARENQAFLDYTIQQSFESAEDRSGRAVVDVLRQAGFSDDSLEVTRDMSLIELPVESVTVAVRFGDECYLGQWGSDWFVSQIESVVATGRCLVGETVSLD